MPTFLLFGPDHQRKLLSVKGLFPLASRAEKLHLCYLYLTTYLYLYLSTHTHIYIYWAPSEHVHNTHNCVPFDVGLSLTYPARNLISSSGSSSDRPMANLVPETSSSNFECGQIPTRADCYPESKEDGGGALGHDMKGTWREMWDLQDFKAPEVWMAALIELWGMCKPKPACGGKKKRQC